MKKIFINVTPWQTRCAVTKDKLLQNVYFESHIVEQLERSFFKGKINNILPGMQTAFVDIGQMKAGFLHISEIDRDLALAHLGDDLIDEEEEKKPKVARESVNISKIFSTGQDVLVQVSKEPIYEKGAKLTTCYTLPGRFIVLMPNIPRVVISKKIDTSEERHRLKDLVRSLLPAGMGAIIRTSSKDKDKKEIAKDVAILVHTWKSILHKFNKAKSTELIHKDLPIYLQVIRDNLDQDVEYIVIDNRDIEKSVTKFVKAISPEFAQKIRFYPDAEPMFSKYDIEKQIESALQNKVELKSGGSIIIETTESMTAIDVNTGKFLGKTNQEDTILKTNLEAAKEISRQLRLRNIGGLIVIDFIDMQSQEHRKRLYNSLEQFLKEGDKFQSVVLQISEFGLVQMTRKRSGKTLQQQLTSTCDCCKGLGYLKSTNTIGFGILRKFAAELKSGAYKGKDVILNLNPVIFNFVSHIEFNTVIILEKDYGSTITLKSNKDTLLEDYKIEIKK